MFDREMMSRATPTSDQVGRMTIEVAESRDEDWFVSVVVGQVDGCFWILHSDRSRSPQIDALREKWQRPEPDPLTACVRDVRIRANAFEPDADGVLLEIPVANPDGPGKIGRWKLTDHGRAEWAKFGGSK